MKNQRFTYLLFIPILLALILVAFGGGTSSSIAAGGACYQVYMPFVTGSGSGGGAPTSINLCEPDGGPVSEVEADFNGDGYADLAIGSPFESVFFNGSDVEEAGAVNVIYGSPIGLSSIGNQIWSRDSVDVWRDPQAYDHFGHDLAVGDFDDDGYDDLAISVPNSSANWPLVDNAGVVHVLYGSVAGLTADGNQLWAQSTGLQGDSQFNDFFGTAVTAGDFDYDGYDDLAVGVIGETVNGVDDAGAINVIYGTSIGLDTPNNQLITQALGGVTTSPGNDDYFGYEMTTGDFNSDGIEDLAVGIPDEDIPTPGGDLTDAGAIQIIYGNGYGLVDTFTNSVTGDFWYADSNPFVAGALEAYDRFGHSLAAGDFNDDSYDDLAVGIPSETHGSGGGAILFAGAINVFYGSISGLDATAAWPAQIWHQGSPGMPDQPEFAERFGYSLAAGDFDNDGYEDLAIGIPFETNGIGVDFGAVNVMFGTSVGLTAANNQFLLEGPLQSEHLDQFGHSLVADDFDGDGFVDLAIGIPNDTPDVVLNTGSVVVRYSNSNGVPGDIGQQKWHQGSPGIIGAPETDERFGDTLP